MQTLAVEIQDRTLKTRKTEIMSNYIFLLYQNALEK
jgi:hypothetical protein